MTDRPIIFSAPMVRALLDGRKTQTRRLPGRMTWLVDGHRASPELWSELDFTGKCWVDAGPSPAGNPGPYLKVPRLGHDTIHRVYPIWQPGDRLWVCHAAG